METRCGESGMDQEQCTLKTEVQFPEDDVKPSILNSFDKLDCIKCEPSDLTCTSLCDIASSSLIKSPLVFELLISHGLLKNGLTEDTPLYDTDAESKFCSIDQSYGPPSFLRIYSLQPPPTTWNNADDDDDDDEKGIYKCGWSSCDMCFFCRKDLAYHVNNSHVNQDENSLYRCHWNGCARQGKAINARYRMLIHIRTHTHEKPHGCEFCGKKFSRLENLRIHIRSHTGEKPYACPVAGCNKAYSNSSDRFKHSKTHQEDKPYVCRVEGCDKRYTDPSSLRKHMKSTAHGGENKQKLNPSSQVTEITERDKPYACKVEGCDKRYTDPSSLRKHQRATSHGRDPNTLKTKKPAKELSIKEIYNFENYEDQNEKCSISSTKALEKNVSSTSNNDIIHLAPDFIKNEPIDINKHILKTSKAIKCTLEPAKATENKNHNSQVSNGVYMGNGFPLKLITDDLTKESNFKKAYNFGEPRKKLRTEESKPLDLSCSSLNECSVDFEAVEKKTLLTGS